MKRIPTLRSQLLYTHTHRHTYTDTHTDTPTHTGNLTPPAGCHLALLIPLFLRVNQLIWVYEEQLWRIIYILISDPGPDVKMIIFGIKKKIPFPFAQKVTRQSYSFYIHICVLNNPNADVVGHVGRLGKEELGPIF